MPMTVPKRGKGKLSILTEPTRIAAKSSSSNMSLKLCLAKGIFIFYILLNLRFSTYQSNSKKEVIYPSNSQSYQEISSINLNVLKIDE
jgi:hypothetical protein